MKQWIKERLANFIYKAKLVSMQYVFPMLIFSDNVVQWFETIPSKLVIFRVNSIRGFSKLPKLALLAFSYCLNMRMT